MLCLVLEVALGVRSHSVADCVGGWTVLWDLYAFFLPLYMCMYVFAYICVL